MTDVYSLTVLEVGPLTLSCPRAVLPLEALRGVLPASSSFWGLQARENVV